MSTFSYALFGIASGSRSMLPTALLIRNRPWPFGSVSPRVQAVVRGGLAAAALGELVADQLPATPSRLAPPGFAPRILLGAFGAAVMARSTGQFWLRPALIGAGGAVAGTVAGARWRQIASQKTGADWPGAVAEDVGALSLSLAAIRSR